MGCKRCFVPQFIHRETLDSGNKNVCVKLWMGSPAAAWWLLLFPIISCHFLFLLTYWQFWRSKWTCVAAVGYGLDFIILICTCFLETFPSSGALGTTSSCRIKAGGEKAPWIPGKVTHIRHYWLNPWQLDGREGPTGGVHSSFLTSAPASCQLRGRPLLLVQCVIVAVGAGSSFCDVLMGDVSTSCRGSCTHSDCMTWELKPAPWAVVSGCIKGCRESLLISPPMSRPGESSVNLLIRALPLPLCSLLSDVWGHKVWTVIFVNLSNSSKHLKKRNGENIRLSPFLTKWAVLSSGKFLKLRKSSRSQRFVPDHVHLFLHVFSGAWRSLK